MKRGERSGALVRTNTPTEYITTAGGWRSARWYEMYCDPAFGGCGKTVRVACTQVRRGNALSCGCLKALKEVDRGGLSRLNGKQQPLYRKWYQMLDRCYNPKHEDYNHYGGRGITVCDAWRDHKTGFKSFYDWAMIHGWCDGLSIDRHPDQNGPYEPGNCRFTDIVGQNNNLRSNRLITAFGETKTIAQWSRDPRYGLFGRKRATDALYQRLNRGWSPVDAISAPSAFEKRS